jgi:hypothetical protein
MIKQPKGTRFKAGPTIAGKFEWSPGFATKLNGKLAEAQRYIDSEVLRLSDPYLPFQTGMLRSKGILGTVVGSGMVTYDGPYARNMYYGKVMVDPVTGAAGFLTADGWRSRKGVRKVVSERKYQYHGALMRGAFWFERMKADKKDQILRGVKKILGVE